jgi:hypothetical protein
MNSTLLQLDIDENHILSRRHDSGGTKDSDAEAEPSVLNPWRNNDRRRFSTYPYILALVNPWS